jgi:hypothetical protein
LLSGLSGGLVHIGVYTWYGHSLSTSVVQAFTLLVPVSKSQIKTIYNI